MELGIAGKRALITGATKGIGRAIAETLIAEGAAVSICARTGTDVDAAVSTLSERGTSVRLAVHATAVGAVGQWVEPPAARLQRVRAFILGTSPQPARD